MRARALLLTPSSSHCQLRRPPVSGQNVRGRRRVRGMHLFYGAHSKGDFTVGECLLAHIDLTQDLQYVTRSVDVLFHGVHVDG